jgi:cellulose synthase/poly-beta-1,6-N-acetylglucosamine synthase-like glycosyltransferase
MIELIALVPTTMLLLIVVSQYFILLRPRRAFQGSYAPPVSVLIPAHNEERYIESTVRSALSSDYPGRLEAIVINDGSTDRTPQILSALRKQLRGLRVISTNHVGKSNALNRGISASRNDVIVVVDGDSDLQPDAIANLVRPLSDPKVAAVGGIVKVKNRSGPISWFQRIEYLYSSFFNSLCDRINGNIFTPGPISAFRRDVVRVKGGFNNRVYLEDVDMALRIIKSGYRIHIAEDAVVRTNVPETVRSWVRQRKRWMKGGIEVIRNHRDIMFRRRFGSCGFYPLPMITYWYFHSIIMGIVIFFQVFGGYYSYFLAYGQGLSLSAAQYFLYWFSILGIINLIYMMASGLIAPAPLLVMSVLLTSLAYPMYLYPYIRYREGFGTRDLVAFFFLFPYWMLVLIVQSASNINWLGPALGRNIWEK